MQTHPDGSQTVTFEFIVHKEKVEEIMEKMRKRETDEKLKAEKKKKQQIHDDDGNTEQDTCLGHAMFEDEDNSKIRGRRSFKLKIKKETQIIEKKKPGPKKASDFKLISSAKHSRAQAQGRGDSVRSEPHRQH